MSKKSVTNKNAVPPAACESDVETLVKIELESINGKPYYGQISDDELVYIWVSVFGKKKEDLFGVTSTKSLTRKIRGTFKLNAPAKLHELFQAANFSYQKVLDDGSVDVVTGRIIGYGDSKPVELGELAKITVKTNFGVEPFGILTWLRLYGTVPVSSNNGFVVSESTGLKTDIFEAEIILKKHVDEYLPMFGQKVIVNYPGIPKMCNHCYVSGHLRRDCNNKKREWVEYIIDLINNHGVKRELIGTWTKAVSRWENANAAAEAKDKRKE
jgi:hypothetical protein